MVGIFVPSQTPVGISLPLEQHSKVGLLKRFIVHRCSVLTNGLMLSRKWELLQKWAPLKRLEFSFLLISGMVFLSFCNGMMQQGPCHLLALILDFPCLNCEPTHFSSVLGILWHQHHKTEKPKPEKCHDRNWTLLPNHQLFLILLWSWSYKKISGPACPHPSLLPLLIQLVLRPAHPLLRYQAPPISPLPLL